MSKPDDAKELPWYRRAQKQVLDATNAAADVAATSLESGKSQLRRLDDSLDISKRAKAVGDAVGEHARRVDSDWRVSEKAEHALDVSKEFAIKASAVGKSISERSGLSALVTATGEIAQERVVDPLAKALVSTGLDKTVDSALHATEHLYGAAREGFKPYFPATDGHALLRATKRELGERPADPH